MRILTNVLLVSSLLAGCTGPTAPQHYPRHWLKDARMDAWQQLDAAKAELNKKSAEPQMQEHVGVGTMFVWSHKLGGGPGWETLSAAYTYKNTTDRKFDMVRVFLEVLDADGKVRNRGEDVLMDPLGYAIGPNDTYSQTLKVKTKGAHKNPGWTWRIACEPIAMKVKMPLRAGN